MKKLHCDGLLTSFDFESYETCEVCLLGKMTKACFMGLHERALYLLELIDTDVCGPMSMTARGGFQYFISFIDDYSRYGYLYLMKHKSKSLEKFKEFQNEVENQRGKKTVGTMLRRRRSCRKKQFSAKAVSMRWPKVPLHEASEFTNRHKSRMTF
jgi:hypothetical protein